MTAAIVNAAMDRQLSNEDENWTVDLTMFRLEL